ncbi:MAG TPA: MTH938/NDUFAF3 family protein [Steroidobacteraceae bacterium]|nr:MTH938/NDUFAF3 family protein [Steroidobacteraceae bacterium]
MKLTLAANSRANLIRSYAPDVICIAEREVRRSCIVTPDALITDWEPGTFADLDVRHLDRVLELAPELIVLATGTTHQFAPAPIRAALAERRIGLESMELGAACRTYNVLVQEERRVAAMLFLR